MDKATRKRITESDFGRKFGWFVELDGKRLASLSSPVWDSLAQFWFLYTVMPLTDSAEERQMLKSVEFWKREDIVYRSQEFDLVHRMFSPH